MFCRLLDQSGYSLGGSWEKYSLQAHFRYQRGVQMWKEQRWEMHPEGRMVEGWLSRMRAKHWLSGQLGERLAARVASGLGPGAEILPCLMGPLVLLEEQMVCSKDLWVA